jgi:hypothetical protein
MGMNMELFLVNIFVNILIGVVGFLIRQHLLALRKDVDEVKAQVYLTNGRLIRLEEWKDNHDKLDSSNHAYVNEAIGVIRKQLENTLDSMK